MVQFVIGIVVGVAIGWVVTPAQASLYWNGLVLKVKSLFPKKD